MLAMMIFCPYFRPVTSFPFFFFLMSIFFQNKLLRFSFLVVTCDASRTYVLTDDGQGYREIKKKRNHWAGLLTPTEENATRR